MMPMLVKNLIRALALQELDRPVVVEVVTTVREGPERCPHCHEDLLAHFTSTDSQPVNVPVVGLRHDLREAVLEVGATP